MGSWSWRRVVAVPGAKGSAKRTCRARDNSPWRAYWQARWNCSSELGARCSAGRGADPTLASRRGAHSPREKAVKRASSVSLGTRAVPAGRWSNNRGRKSQSFQARSAAGVVWSGEERIRVRVAWSALRRGPVRKEGRTRNKLQGRRRTSSAGYGSREARAASKRPGGNCGKGRVGVGG